MFVHCCQFSPAWEDKASNYEALVALLDDSDIRKDSLVVLPELFATGFSMDFARLAEPLDAAPTLNFLADQARDRSCHILAGIALRGKDELTNDAVLVSPSGEVSGRYRKIHPFTPSGEKAAASAGREVVTMSLGQWTLAPFICYDLRFPEIFRMATPRAELLVVLANWPTPREAHWVTLLKARAIENQAYVVGVNRVGSDPHLDFPGRSLIISPKGEVIADAGDATTVLSAELHHCQVREWRRDFAAHSDRHPFEQLTLNPPLPK